MHIEADLKNTFFRARLVECREIYVGVRGICHALCPLYVFCECMRAFL